MHKAIRVNDHALSCAQFHGEIPEGYGKGTVKIWDSGHMTYLEDRLDHQLVFILYGEKLVGKYCILPFQDYFLLYKLS
jgi:bifunctional non-homologous end joining protein LigD